MSFNNLLNKVSKLDIEKAVAVLNSVKNSELGKEVLESLKSIAENQDKEQNFVDIINFGSPYREMEQIRDNLIKALDAAPEYNGEVGSISPLDVSLMKNSIRQTARKPRMGVFGHFDMGKSRLCNLLLGGDFLPTSYQPTTSMACILRHISDKPVWQDEDVWIMGKDFDLQKVDEEQHCKDNLIFSTDLSSLKDNVSHKDNTDDINEGYYAIVYLDSSLLLSCDLLDMPGYENDEKDLSRTELASTFVDVVLYLSTAQGFLGKNDLDYIGSLLNVLPSYENEEIKSLDNIFIIATRSDIIDNHDDRILILDKAAKRAFKHLDLKLDEREAKKSISENDFRERFFTFSANNNNQDLREGFISDLSKLLGKKLPNWISLNFYQSMNKSIDKIQKKYSVEANNLSKIIEQRNKSRESLNSLKGLEEFSKIERKKKTEEIKESIKNYKRDSVQEARRVIKGYLDVGNIERMIESRYDSKKEAKELASSYLSESIQHQINKILNHKSQQLSTSIDALLESYNQNHSLNVNIELGFDSKGVFMGAIAGLTTFGALATWATVVAAGSNLGAYLLIPSVVSFLSGLGISVGGTSAAISLVAALGGPITIGIGIAVLIGGAFAWLGGSSWQKRMAEKISDIFKKEDFEEKTIEGIKKYWDDTLKAFEESSTKTEEVFLQKMQSLEDDILKTPDDVVISRRDYCLDLVVFLYYLKNQLKLIPIGH